MTDKTNTDNTVAETNDTYVQVAQMQVGQDLRHSILIVSLLANLIFFTAWITLQVTTQYDVQIAHLLFVR